MSDQSLLHSLLGYVLSCRSPACNGDPPIGNRDSLGSHTGPLASEDRPVNESSPLALPGCLAAVGRRPPSLVHLAELQNRVGDVTFRRGARPSRSWRREGDEEQGTQDEQEEEEEQEQEEKEKSRKNRRTRKLPESRKKESTERRHTRRRNSQPRVAVVRRSIPLRLPPQSRWRGRSS